MTVDELMAQLSTLEPNYEICVKNKRTFFIDIDHKKRQVFINNIKGIFNEK